jgi:nucleoid-associated protein YgaU
MIERMFASPFARRRLGALLLICVLAMTALLLAPSRSSGAGTLRSHVVRPGETVWSIALTRYDGDPREHVSAIADANALDGAIIRVGQRLVLP